MLLLRPRDSQRCVFRFGTEPCGFCATESQSFISHPKLRDSTCGSAHDLLRLYSLFEFIEHGPARLVIDRGAIIRVNQPEVPQLAALIGIWNSRRGIT